MRFALILVPLMLLAGCGGGGGNSSTPVTSTTPVAKAQPPAGKSWLDTVAKTEEGYRQGNPNAPIKLVEYGSRSCPVCGAFANTGVEPLRQKYVSTGQVSYEFRDFWVHNQDPGVSLLGNCVSTEAFFPILDQMFANQDQFNLRATQEVFDRIRTLPPAQQPAAWAEALGYIDFMKQRGVPETKARQCLGDPAMLKTMQDRIQKVAESGKIPGTPTFFINDQVVSGAVSWEQLEPALQAAGAR